MSRTDFEPLRALQAYLSQDLESVLGSEANRLGAELVGDLCVHIVVDETNDLEDGHAVIRVGFAPTNKLQAPMAGEMTVRLDSLVVSGEFQASTKLGAGYETVQIQDSAELGRPCLLAWSHGEATIHAGIRTILGRPHQTPPARFVGLRGASQRINKEHCFVLVETSKIVIGRFSSANPVEVNGRRVEAAEQIEVTASPIEVSLSRGDLLLTLTRT